MTDLWFSSTPSAALTDNAPNASRRVTAVSIDIGSRGEGSKRKCPRRLGRMLAIILSLPMTRSRYDPSLPLSIEQSPSLGSRGDKQAILSLTALIPSEWGFSSDLPSEARREIVYLIYTPGHNNIVGSNWVWVGGLLELEWRIASLIQMNDQERFGRLGPSDPPRWSIPLTIEKFILEKKFWVKKGLFFSNDWGYQVPSKWVWRGFRAFNQPYWKDRIVEYS